MGATDWDTLERIAIILGLLDGVVYIGKILNWVYRRRASIAVAVRAIGEWLILVGIVTLPWFPVMAMAILVSSTISLLEAVEGLVGLLVMVVIPASVSATTAASGCQARDRALVVETVIGVPYSVAVVVWGLEPSVSLTMRIVIGVVGLLGLLVFAYLEAELAWLVKRWLVARGWFAIEAKDE